jgi:arylsulfatase A-like enzyme
MRRRLARSALVGMLVVVAACTGEPRKAVPVLPETIAADDVVAELGTQVGRVTRRSPTAAPTVAGVQPAHARGRRVALLAPAPAAVEYEIQVPPGGLLRVGTAVVFDERDEPRREHASPVRFRVLVGGQPVWEHLWEPEGRQHRHWVDAEIDLGRFADRRVTLRLETEATDAATAAGVPAWSRIQLVRRTVTARRASSPAAPNVLLLVVDTLRADRVGAYGARPSRTPNLDRLAASGIVFRHTWAQAPWTLPSVTTILTGRYPRGHGVVGRSADFGRPAGLADDDRNWAYLADTIPTIASLARRAGLTTVGITSNLLISRENNLARGFETFVELPVAPMPVQWARAAAVHRAFGDWLAVNGRHRFFAYLHYMEPHDPYVPGERRATCPAGAPADVCDGVVRNLARRRERGGPALDASIVRYLETLYDGEVASWDAELPGLLAVLDREGLRDRTVLVVTADHGEEFAEHGQLGHRKQLYAESLAVPLVMSGPGIPAAVRDDLVELVDVLPTILGLLDVADDGSGTARPGHDLFRGPTGRVRTFAETRYGVVPGEREPLELLGVRERRWGYMRAPAVGYERLHDLVADPLEIADRAAAHPGVCATLRGELDAWKARTPPPAAPPSQAEHLTDKLRALGYVE